MIYVVIFKAVLTSPARFNWVAFFCFFSSVACTVAVVHQCLRILHLKSS